MIFWRQIHQLHADKAQQRLEAVCFFFLISWMLFPVIRLLSSVFAPFEPPGFILTNNLIFSGHIFNFLMIMGHGGIAIAIVYFMEYLLRRAGPVDMSAKKVLQNIVSAFFFLFLLWSFLAALLSDNFQKSFHGHPYRNEGFLTYLAYAGLFFCASRLSKPDKISTLLHLFVWSALCLAVFSQLDNRAINQAFAITRRDSIFHNANHFGYFLNLSILCASYLFTTSSENKYLHAVVYLLSLSLLVITLVFNASLGSYLGAASGIMFLSGIGFWLCPEKRYKFIVLVVVFFLASFYASFLTGFLSSEINKLRGGVTDIVTGSENAGRAGSNRWLLWQLAIEQAKERPWFGYGLDNLPQYELLTGEVTDRPHNEYLQFAASQGIPALLFYLTALALHFKRILTLRRCLSVEQIGLYAVVFAYLVGAFFGNTMYYTTPFFVIFLSISIHSVNVTEMRFRKNMLG